MRLWWAALALVSLFAAASGSSAEPPAPSAQPAPAATVPPTSPAPAVVVNGVSVPLAIPPSIRDGVLVAPLAPIVQAFGGTMAWDPAARTATLTGTSGRTARLIAGQSRMSVTVPAGSPAGGPAGEVVSVLPFAPALDHGGLWGPVAPVLWALGAYVKASDDGRTLDVVTQITDVAWREDGGRLAVTVSATGPVRAAARLLRAPDRLVVDFTSAVIRLRDATRELGVAGVLRVRGAQFQVRPYVTRLVFDLAHPVAFDVTVRPSGVVLALSAGTHGAASSNTLQAPAPSSPAPAVPAAQPAPSSPAPAAPATPGATGESTSPAAPAAPPEGVAPEPMALPPLPEFTDRPGAFHIRTVAYEDAAGGGRITITASQPVTYTVRQFVYPDRLAIDIPGGVFLSRRHDIEVGSDAVRNVVVSQFALAPNLTRVLVHLRHKTPYAVAATNGGRALIVGLGLAGRAQPRGTAVVIDAGHGGADGGAVGPTGLREADVALRIGLLVRQALARLGIRAVLTRTEDSTVALEDRPDLAQRAGGMLFVSIHANASRNPDSAGTETYYRTPESRPLAAALQSEVARALGAPDRGIHTAEFYVLVNTPMPSALIETAFISNAQEEGLLRDPAVQARIADAIARGIEKFMAEQRLATSP